MPTLEDLNDFDTVAMEEWLRHRLSDLYSEDAIKRVAAADFSAFGLAGYESVLDALSYLYRMLNPVAQGSLRKAVGSLLRHSRPTAFPAEGMKDLVLLVGLLDAHSELSAFEAVLGSGDWGELEPELFYCALAVLKGLRKGDEAYTATKRLITCSNFPGEYVFDAYEILIGGRPEHWDIDLIQLGDAMALLDRAIEQSGDDALAHDADERYVNLTDDILAAVGLERLAAGLSRLMQRSDQLTTSKPAGRVIALFAEGVPSGGITVDPETSNFVLKKHGSLIGTVLDNLPVAGELFIDSRVHSGVARLRKSSDVAEVAPGATIGSRPPRRRSKSHGLTKRGMEPKSPSRNAVPDAGKDRASIAWSKSKQILRDARPPDADPQPRVRSYG